MTAEPVRHQRSEGSIHLTMGPHGIIRLREAHAAVEVTPVDIHTRDEFAIMASEFNVMQAEAAAADERRKQRESDRIAKATADADAAEAALALIEAGSPKADTVASAEPDTRGGTVASRRTLLLVALWVLNFFCQYGFASWIPTAIAQKNAKTMAMPLSEETIVAPFISQIATSPVCA